jgi:hypothetical protein
MSKIVCFIQYIENILPDIYHEYEKLLENDVTECGVLFTDGCEVFINSSIAIFHTFYIREHFLDSIIILDYKDSEYISQYLKNRCVVLCHDKTLVNDSKEYLAVLEYGENIGEKLKHEKV